MMRKQKRCHSKAKATRASQPASQGGIGFPGRDSRVLLFRSQTGRWSPHHGPASSLDGGPSCLLAPSRPQTRLSPSRSPGSCAGCPSPRQSPPLRSLGGLFALLSLCPRAFRAGWSPSSHVPSAQARAPARQPGKGHGDPDSEQVEKQAILQGNTEALTVRP